MPHDIGYSGPDGQYEPPQGYNLDAGRFTPPPTASRTASFADVNLLEEMLADLIATSQALISVLEVKLQNFSLAVTPSDQVLTDAHSIMWPSDLGTPQNYITYRYYKSLENVNSAAATFIRSSYEKAARGVTGTNAIDILPVAQMTLTEAQLIQEFVGKYAAQLDDSSQRRTVELFEIWADTAQKQIGSAQAVFTQGNTPPSIPAEEVGSLSTADASNSQALFQVGLNQFNLQVTQSLGLLQQTFANHASVFYNNFLGPAMNVRINSLSGIGALKPVALGPTLQQLTQSASNVVNNHMTMALGDLMRRSNVYNSQVTELMTVIQQRDAYRSYIGQLANAGQPVPVGTSGTMVNTTDTSHQALFFDGQATAPATTPTNQFTAPHSELSGVNDPTAHPQYILKGGDSLTGDLALSGGTVDGTVPSTHAHTGEDGTVQLHGENIIPGTVTTTTIDTTTQPAPPSSLLVESQNQVTVSPGVATVSLNLAWTGDPNATHEVQITKVS